MLGGTEIPVVDFEAHATFFIKDVGTELDGSYTLEVRCLACHSEELGQKIEERFTEHCGSKELQKELNPPRRGCSVSVPRIPITGLVSPMSPGTGLFFLFFLKLFLILFCFFLLCTAEGPSRGF